MSVERSEQKSEQRSISSALIAVAATYVYFLLWAQFGFLHLLQARTDSDGIQLAMAAMGVSGLLASFFVGWRYRRLAALNWIRLGFAISAIAALAALAAGSTATLVVAAAMIGVGTAVLTVSLAAGLWRLVDERRRGLAIGLGTGLAYFFCNVPWLFEGSPATQAAAVLAVCGLGLWALSRPDFEAAPSPPQADEKASEASSDRLLVASVVASFLVLIWLDSAAFAIIQENLAFKAQTWGGPARQWLLGSVHLAAAVLAGRLLDGGRFRSLLLGAFATFAVAFTVLQHSPVFAAFTGPIYAVGISLYSVALVFWASADPADGRERVGVVPRRWRAALVFGIGGWLGSALGVGMAQDLHRIPTVFLWLTGAVLVAGALIERRGSRPLFAAFGRAHGLTLLGATLGVAMHLVVAPGVPPVNDTSVDDQVVGDQAVDDQAVGDQATAPVRGLLQASHLPANHAPASLDAARRGRLVYVREGCIHCHSQYVRPGTRDEHVYGEHAPLDRDVDPRDAGPVMIGTRRQGPDLSHVGERRSAAWLRAHLESPPPGSRMPSYGHLFDDGRAGDDLVAYLGSLARPPQSTLAEVVAPDATPSEANDGGR